MQLEFGNIFNEWLRLKNNSPDASIDAFVFNLYQKIHRSESSEEENQIFCSYMTAWHKYSEEFDMFVAKQSKELTASQEILSTEQAAEMLDNVIYELGMKRNECFHFLSNVKLIISYRLAKFLAPSVSEQFIKTIEERYNKEWEIKDISEDEQQNIFAETVSFMRYAGVGYNDETRAILAKIGIGRDVEFSNIIPEKPEEDIRFLSIFLLYEIFSQNMPQEIKEEKILIERVIPASISAASMATHNKDSLRLFPLYIENILPKNNHDFLTALSNLLTASNTLFTIPYLTPITYSAIKITLTTLWNYCKTESITNHDYNFLDFLNSKSFSFLDESEKTNQSDNIKETETENAK